MHPTVQLLAAYGWRLIVIAAVVVGAIWLLGQLRVVLVPVVIALLVSRLLEPMAAQLRRRGFRPSLAAATVLLGFAAVLGAIGFVIVPGVVDQFADLGPTLTKAVDDVETWLVEDAPIQLTREDIESARQQVGRQLSDRLSSSDGSLAGAAALLVEIPTGGILAIFLTFFMVKDGHRLVRFVQERVPRERAVEVTRAGRGAWSAIGGYLRGAALLGLVEGVIIGVAVFLVGGELAMPIAVLTFAAAFVPIVGAIVAGIVAVLVTLVTAGGAAAVVIAVVALVVQQLDNDLLAPVIYGRLVQVHPVAILLGVVTGGALFGVIGTLVAVPTLVVAIGVATEIRDARAEVPDDSPRDALPEQRG